MRHQRIRWLAIRAAVSVAAVALLGVGSPCLGTNLLGGISFPGARLQEPQPGQWAEYLLVTDGDKGEPKSLRVAIVGVEDEADRSCYWLEMAVDDEGGTVTFKLLVTPDVSDPRPLRRIILRRGKGMTYEAPPEFVADQIERLATSRGGELLPVGQETQLQAGREFAARRCRYASSGGDVDVWVSPEAPIFGLVRKIGHDLEMTLVDFGMSGAHGAVNDVPVPLPLPGVMRGKTGR